MMQRQAIIFMLLLNLSACGQSTAEMVTGTRLSRVIGSAVYNDHGAKIGSIDDLISRNPKIDYAIVSVGGFLGIGSKLVAVPYDHLKIDMNEEKGEHVIMAGATKASLMAMTPITYSLRSE